MLSKGAASTPKLPTGLDAAWAMAAGRVVGLTPRRRGYLHRAETVLALEPQYADRADARLREAARGLRETFRLGRETQDDVHHALAVVREVASRTLGLKPYPVQVAAALALHDGCVAEQATGEGKTLTASMPAVIAGWRGRGCHVVTVNDYLAARDASNMGAVYRFCGLRSAHVAQGMPPAERRRAYHADITYCTNKEVTADYLRDRLILGRAPRLTSAIVSRMLEGHGAGTDRLLMRGLATAIVDEADSVLIDEAVTPLIISGDAPNDEQAQAFAQAAAIAREMTGGRDYRVDQRYRDVTLTRGGRARLALIAAELGGLWNGMRRAEELVSQAINARELFSSEQQYVMQDGKIVIVDEFTGRLMPDRTWRAGLHQAVEAKEGLEIQPPKETLARVSFQRYFRLYPHLCGMTGTAWESRHELYQVYGMATAVFPTHHPCIRTIRGDRMYADEETKWRAIVDEIQATHASGRPVLIGTRSVRSSEHLSDLLAQRRLEHQVLNAVRHAEEAAIVAEAGQAARITVATNMAGRGTDIKLGRGVARAGGLHVIATERHESGRIDRQLFGRCARQGDPGSAAAFVSLEDELLLRYASRAARRAHQRYAGVAEPMNTAEAQSLVLMAQRKAERTAMAQRKAVLSSDNWLDRSLGFAGRE